MAAMIPQASTLMEALMIASLLGLVAVAEAEVVDPLLLPTTQTPAEVVEVVGEQARVAEAASKYSPTGSL